MGRFFIEVAYKGTQYGGFQIQKNADTVQGQVEKALHTYLRKPITLTGSSRTDAGVHACQNFFHFDISDNDGLDNPDKLAYHLNAILPNDIAVNSIKEVTADAHCRFDAELRQYHYTIYQKKNPFISEQAYYYPFPLDMDLMNEAASFLITQTNFKSFAKAKSQVFTFNCNLLESRWTEELNGRIVYKVTGNRFLRGMVKALVGTMLLVGRQKITLDQLKKITGKQDASAADFSPPGHGLCLMQVRYPATIYI